MRRTRVSSPFQGNGPYHIPIENLNLSLRGYNCLRQVGLMTDGHILEKSEGELLAVRSFGVKQYEELHARLADMDILPLDAPWDS